MSKILETLKTLLPADQVTEVSSAIEASLGEAKVELEKEFSTKLEEAYGELTTELKEAEKVAETGYAEAFGIITDLRNRLETQRSEYEHALEEGYEEAYQMLLAERGKKETLESELYEAYDKKLGQMKEYMVDKIDQFLAIKGKEIYEQAKRDVVNDPALVEHKMTLDKIVETVSEYISDDEFASVTNSKVEETKKTVEELKAQVRLLESKNIRISTENSKLHEAVRQGGELLKEHTVKETEKKAEKAEGRGKKVLDRVEVIAEAKDAAREPEARGDKSLADSLGTDLTDQWKVLSGIKSK